MYQSVNYKTKFDLHYATIDLHQNNVQCRVKLHWGGIKLLYYSVIIYYSKTIIVLNDKQIYTELVLIYTKTGVMLNRK